MQRGIKWPEDGSEIYDETLREPFPWFRSKTSLPQTSWFTPRYDKPNDGISVEEQGKRGRMLDRGPQPRSSARALHPAFANGEIESVLSDSEDWLVFAKGKYLVHDSHRRAGE